MDKQKIEEKLDIALREFKETEADAIKCPVENDKILLMRRMMMIVTKIEIYRELLDCFPTADNK